MRRRALAAATLITGLLIAAYYALRETLLPSLRDYHDLIIQAYSLMVIALLAVSGPWAWRFFTGRLRRAFAALPDQGFWRFIITPAIFFVVDQIYIDLLYGRMFRETGDLDGQTFLIFLLVLAAEFVVYYFLMRTAMETARHARMEVDLRSMERPWT